MDAAPAMARRALPSPSLNMPILAAHPAGIGTRLGVLNQLAPEIRRPDPLCLAGYPVITLLSPGAAEAGQCANEQGKFWDTRCCLRK